MIPISLIVSTEIIKMVQGIFIRLDINLYSKSRHCFCGVKAVSIIEELGNVNFIFSDKTGTLTKNQLQFKYCIINSKFYQYFKSSKSKKKQKRRLLSNRIINKKKIETKKTVLNIFASKYMRNRRSNAINQVNMSKKRMLEEISINDNSDIISRINPKKNSCTNNMFMNSKFTFLKKLSDFEKN
jgi:magnesium-transporting ATPase (P-type)